MGNCQLWLWPKACCFSGRSRHIKLSCRSLSEITPRLRDYSSRGEDKAEKEPGDQSAKVCRHAHLRGRQIERCLDRNDHEDICQSSFCVRRVTMLHQKPSPCADDAHYASRCADELSHLNETNYSQNHNPRA